jgi:hypothetical protein
MLGVAKADLKWVGSTSRPRDYYFLRHFLAINDFRIHLKLACAASDITLLGFIPDYYGERTPTGGTAKYIRDVICDINREQKTVSHTPDGVFALQKGESTALFFLEIDRGTEVVGDEEKGVLKSLRFYSNYLLTNGYQRYEADFGVTAFKGFRSLYVTSSKTRLANIRRSAAQLTVAQKVRRFHWIVASEELTEKSLLTPIWLSCDHEDTTKYQIG